MSVPVPLRLRLTHGFGDARSGWLSISPDGTGMAEALEMCGDRLNDARWRAANLCRIVWQSKGRGWQLSNGSRTLTCALNGERLAPDTWMPIAVGDTVELGLLRFVVERDSDEKPESPAATQSASISARQIEPTSVPHVSADSSLATARDEEVVFDLSDLASSDDGGMRPNLLDDPFGVLDIPGVARRSDVNALAVLLGESSPPRDEGPGGRHATTLPLGAGHVQSAPSENTHRSAERSAQGTGNPEPTSIGVLFDGLHEEFVRVVRDPGQLSGRTDWEGVLAQGHEQAPTLEELSQRAMSFPLLRDIILSQTSIDQLIDHFDPLGQSDLLEDQEPDDVLRLFAPDIERSTTPQVPSLTRREHHEFSLDSHVWLGQVRTEDQEPT